MRPPHLSFLIEVILYDEEIFFLHYAVVGSDRNSYGTTETLPQDGGFQY